MRNLSFIIFFYFFISNVRAQDTPFRLFLVGDAGDNESTGETLDSLKSQLNSYPNSAVIFLGDNSYKNALWGLFPYGYKGFDRSRSTQRKVRSQLDILTGYKGSAYFIPGNHDWWNKTNFKRGRRKLKMEESFIEANLRTNKTLANPDSVFLPRDGTPGPVSVDLNNKKMKVVFIDTYWLILLGFKKTPEENHLIEKEFYQQLDSLLADGTTKGQKIIVVAHHPVYSKTSFKAKQIKHPNLLSRIKLSYRSFPSYTDLANKINAILLKYPGIYYASGHIHALQYYEADNVHYIISGAGSKTHHVKKQELQNNPPCNSASCRLWNEKGFFEIDFYDNMEKVILYHCSGRKHCDISEAADCSSGCN